MTVLQTYPLPCAVDCLYPRMQVKLDRLLSVGAFRMEQKPFNAELVAEKFLR